MTTIYNYSCICQQPWLFDCYNTGCEPLRMDLKDRVIAARTHAGLTQVELAERVGVKQQTIQKLEAGKSKRSAKLAEIALECQVSVEWLARGEGPMLASQPVRGEAGKLVARRNEIGLSTADVHARMLAFEWPEGVEPPELATVADWFDGRQRPVDVNYLRGLYKALEMDVEAQISAPPTEARTALSQSILNRVERMSARRQERLLALLMDDDEIGQ